MVCTYLQKWKFFCYIHIMRMYLPALFISVSCLVSSVILCISLIVHKKSQSFSNRTILDRGITSALGASRLLTGIALLIEHVYMRIYALLPAFELYDYTIFLFFMIASYCKFLSHAWNSDSKKLEWIWENRFLLLIFWVSVLILLNCVDYTLRLILLSSFEILTSFTMLIIAIVILIRKGGPRADGFFVSYSFLMFYFMYFLVFFAWAIVTICKHDFDSLQAKCYAYAAILLVFPFGTFASIAPPAFSMVY